MAMNLNDLNLLESLHADAAAGTLYFKKQRVLLLDANFLGLLRGRQSGGAAQLLYQAAEEAMPGIAWRVVLDEQDALELAIHELQEGEIVVIFYDQLAAVRAVLERHSAVPVTTLNGTSQVGKPIGAVAAGASAHTAEIHLLKQQEEIYAAGESKSA